MLADITALWNPATVTAAVVAGLLIGLGPVGWLLTRTRWANAHISAAEWALVVGVMSAIVGIGFFVGQLIAAAHLGDALAYRLASRYSLFLVYAPFIGAGTFLTVWRTERIRARGDRRKAAAQIEQEDRRR